MTAMSEADRAGAYKYVVAPRLGHWRVSRAGAKARAFDIAHEAIAFACELARDHARGGHLAMVVVKADVQELHCFTPAAAAPLSSRRLRLVRGAEQR